MATLNDIAREVGVSVSTVSRALSGYPHIDERTRRRVQQAAKSFNYQPNALARALRRSQTKTVGLVIPDILNRFYAAGAAVLQKTLEQHGYRLIVCISNDDPESEVGYFNALLQQRVDGILYVPCTPEGAKMIRDEGNSVPVVELNRCSESALFDGVISDDQDGTLQLTRYLIGLGHRNIAVIAGTKQFSTTQARMAGIREAFRQAHLPFNENLVRYRDYSVAWGSEAMFEFLRSDPRPTAVFAGGNQIALGALHALTEAGLHIPGDISLAGFDDPDWFSVWRPEITTYALPLEDMGLIAAQLLLARMTARSSPTMPTITRLSGRLVIRGSCSPPKQQMMLVAPGIDDAVSGRDQPDP